MANVTVDSLIPSIRIRAGDSKSEEYTDTQLGDFCENGGVQQYNLEMTNEFTITGTGSARYFSPAPTQEEQRLLVLLTAKVVLIDRAIQAAGVAISFSNPVSNVDLKQVPKMLSTQIEMIDKEVAIIKKRRAQRGLVDGMEIERLSKAGSVKEISWGYFD